MSTMLRVVAAVVLMALAPGYLFAQSSGKRPVRVRNTRLQGHPQEVYGCGVSTRVKFVS